MADEFQRIKVSIDVEFMVPMHNETVSKINGWTLEEIIEDWFKTHNINAYHRTRDTYEIGGSKVITNIEVLK